MSRTSFNHLEIVKLLAEDTSGHELAAYVRKKNRSSSRACSRLMSFDPKRLSLSINVVKARKPIQTHSEETSDSENEPSAELNNASLEDANEVMPVPVIKCSQYEAKEGSQAANTKTTNAEKPVSPFVFSPEESSTPLKELPVKNLRKSIHNKISQTTQTFKPTSDDDQQNAKENKTIEATKIATERILQCSTAKQSTFTVADKDMELAPFMLTQTICGTPNKSNTIQNSVHNTPIVEKEKVPNEDAVTSTQDLLETEPLVNNSQVVTDNCTFDVEKLPKARKSILFKSAGGSRSTTPKKVNFDNLNVEETLDLLHKPAEANEANEAENSCNPLNLAQSPTHSEVVVIKSKRLILENSSAPLNLASSPTHKQQENQPNHHHKDIPLNKAPSTPINGEKFADELKKQLARLSNYQIIDLRKRKSVGQLFSSASQQVLRQVEEQLELELIKRKLNETEVEEAENLGVALLSPPQEFACIENLAKRMDAATSVSTSLQEVPQTNVASEAVEAEISHVTRATQASEEVEIMPSPPGTERQLLSPVAIVPPPPLFNSVRSPLVEANRNLCPTMPTPTTLPLPEICSQIILTEGEQLTGEDHDKCVSLQPPSEIKKPKMDTLIQEYLNVSKKVRKKRYASRKNLGKRSLYTENSPRPLNQAEQVVTPPPDFEDGIENATSSKEKSIKEKKSKSSIQTDVFKEPLAPAPKRRKIKATTTTTKTTTTTTTVAQQAETTNDGNGTILRRSSRPRVQAIDLRAEYMQSFYTKCHEKALESMSIYKKQQRLSKARSRISTLTSTRRESSNERGPAFSLLGDTNATNSTMNGGLSIRSVAQINADVQRLSPILEPIAEQKEADNPSSQDEKTKAKKQTVKKSTKTVKQPPNSNEVNKERKSNKAKTAGKDSQKKSVKNEKSGVEHSRLNFSFLPVNELNHLFDHHQQTDQNGSKLQEVENVKEKTQKEETNRRQLRVRLKRIDTNEATLEDTVSQAAKLKTKKTRGKYKKKRKPQETEADKNTEVVSSSTEPVNMPEQNVQDVQNEGIVAQGSDVRVDNDKYKLMNWLTGICATELQTVNYDLLEEMSCSPPSSLVFAELDGIAYAFYDTKDACSLGYLRFMPLQVKKTKRAQKYHLHFIVLSGKFQISTDKDKAIFDVGCMIAINIGARYKIENITNDIGLIMVMRK